MDLTHNTLDVEQIKLDFPIFSRSILGKPITYLDSAATTQKPKTVIDAVNYFYENFNANVHRGIYKISQEATEAFESARSKIAKFINAESSSEIVFTKNATESINLVTYSWGRKNVFEQDRVVLTELEHHSNLVPWQFLSKENKCELDFIPVNKDGKLSEVHFDNIAKKNTKLLGVTQVSNVLGTINPVKEMVKIAHECDAVSLVDAAQSVPHMPVDVQDIGCDFLVFSGHKTLGPMGVGVLYGKKELLEKMDPFIYGGDMIKSVSKTESKWNDVPWKFEGGTSSVADAIGLGAAIDYLNKIGLARIRAHEIEVTDYALKELMGTEGVVVYGPKDPSERGGVISFNLAGIHPHDLASILDEEGIAIRAGHHCAMPLMEKLDVSATARVSFYIYNSKSDVDLLIKGLRKAKQVFKL